MDVSFSDKIGKRLVRRAPESKAGIADGALVIDCRGCDFHPDPGSKECIRCMVESMCASGMSQRIVLRSGRDTEVSGESGRVLKEAASLRLWSIPAAEDRGRCAKCGMSRYKVMGRAWATFPDDGIQYARDMLEGPPLDGEGCRRCTERTAACLDQLEEGIRSLTDGMWSP